MSRFGDPIPNWLSGHAAGDAPSAEAHLAISPLANVGFAYSDGGLMGLALIVPRAQEEKWRGVATPADFEESRRLSRALTELQKGNDKGVIELKLGGAGVCRLQPVRALDWKSLDPGRYCAQSAIWSSATPIALDRFTKSKDVERLEGNC